MTQLSSLEQHIIVNSSWSRRTETTLQDNKKPESLKKIDDSLPKSCFDTLEESEVYSISCFAKTQSLKRLNLSDFIWIRIRATVC